MYDHLNVFSKPMITVNNRIMWYDFNVNQKFENEKLKKIEKL